MYKHEPVAKRMFSNRNEIDAAPAEGGVGRRFHFAVPCRNADWRWLHGGLNGEAQGGFALWVTSAL
jgi:hypothetical protein